MQFICNKLDELEVWAKFKREVKETCLLAFTKTWLIKSDQGVDLLVSEFGRPFQLDQSPTITNN